MSSLKKSILFSVGEKYLIFAIQFCTSIIIARLLTPAEFGVFSIGSIFLSFSHIFRDIGISNYVIQEKNLSKDRLQTAQSLLFATSWTLAIILWSINGLCGIILLRTWGKHSNNRSLVKLFDTTLWGFVISSTKAGDAI